MGLLPERTGLPLPSAYPSIETKLGAKLGAKLGELMMHLGSLPAYARNLTVLATGLAPSKRTRRAPSNQLISPPPFTVGEYTDSVTVWTTTSKSRTCEAALAHPDSANPLLWVRQLPSAQGQGWRGMHFGGHP